MLTRRDKLIYGPQGRGCILSLPGLPGIGDLIYDRSGQGNHGTITGATWVRLSSGLWGNSFDGIDDIINCGAQSILNLSTVTLLVWVKRTSVLGTIEVLMGKVDTSAADEGYRLSYWSDDKFTLTIHKVADYHSTGLVSHNIWNLLGVTYNGSTTNHYLNGLLDRTQVAAGSITNTNRAFLIGASWNAGALSQLFTGFTALARTFNTVLTAAEIAGIYNRERHLFGV